MVIVFVVVIVLFDVSAIVVGVDVAAVVESNMKAKTEGSKRTDYNEARK